MVSRLPLWERRRICDYGGRIGIERRVRGDDNAVSGMQSLVEGDLCAG